MKFFIKNSQKRKDLAARQVEKINKETEIKILDRLIENVLEIDDQKAEALAKKNEN